MIKKFSLVVALGLLVMTTACKKENVTENSTDIDTLSVAQPSVTLKDTNVVATTQEVPADGKYPVMTFNHDEHDFGTIKQGDKVVYDFKFKNTGEADLLITAAKGSCGCTVPEYPKTAIKAGESGNIKVSFDSKGKQGENTKTVTIMCNTKEGNKLLKIKANIEVPKKN
jgi:outer membrane biosynthesis protein TonB